MNVQKFSPPSLESAAISKADSEIGSSRAGTKTLITQALVYTNAPNTKHGGFLWTKCMPNTV